MAKVEVIVPSAGARRWQAETIARLRSAGHQVAVSHGVATKSSIVLGALLWGERLVFRLRGPLLSDKVSIPHEPSTNAEITLNLTGGTGDLGVAWTGGDLVGLAACLAAGTLPDIALVEGEKVVAAGHPMVDYRISVARSLDDVLARVVTLAVSGVARIAAGETPSTAAAFPESRGPGLLAALLTRGLPRFIAEAWRRARYFYAHWTVGYRLIDGDGVAEQLTLAGAPWQQLPDDGTRFYADPFPFHWQGTDHIFVEDYDHALSVACISVSKLDADGRASTPMPVLNEPYHLSYPQVFELDGEIWMLPEGSAGRELVLYRAEHFPDRWVRHAVLMSDIEISDATLVRHDSRYWLFATHRDGAGSTSDTMVVYAAERLEGPWHPHRANPIRIDRRTARPGGAAIQRDGRLFLPVQDGTKGYGGGLAIVEILRLDDEAVAIGPAASVSTTDWPHPMVHTLNRAGRLEVIDGISAARRR